MKSTLREYAMKLSSSRVSNQEHVYLIQPEISGGVVTKEQIDNIAEYRSATMLSISGLKADTFEYLAQNFGTQFKVLNFFKCPLLPDLSAMEKFSNVSHIYYYWNQRTSRFWDFRKTGKLVGFQFEDFSKLHDLSELSDADSIKELRFGNKIWSKCVFNSLYPIGKMKGLKHLDFDAKKIVDESLKGLADLTSLESINFSPKLFETIEVAWLSARLSNSIISDTLTSHRSFDPIKLRGKNIDVQVIGKGKPILDSQQDEKKLEKYKGEFRAMVEYFLKNENAKPTDYACAS